MTTDSLLELYHLSMSCSNFTWLLTREVNETDIIAPGQPPPNRYLFSRFVHDCRPNTILDNHNRCTYAFIYIPSPHHALITGIWLMHRYEINFLPHSPGIFYRQNIRKSWLSYQINDPFLSPPR
jgi:hypothetical protein